MPASLGFVVDQHDTRQQQLQHDPSQKCKGQSLDFAVQVGLSSICSTARTDFNTYTYSITNRAGRSTMSDLNPAGNARYLRPRRSVASYAPGQYSESTANPTTTTIPEASAPSDRSGTGSHTHTTIQGRGRIKVEPREMYSNSDGEEEIDQDAEADTGEEVKLEQRRERNRIKQRNLRSKSALFRSSHSSISR